MPLYIPNAVMNVETSLSKNNKKKQKLYSYWNSNYFFFFIIIILVAILYQNHNLVAKFEYLQKENQKLKNDIEFLKKKNNM